MNTHFRRTAALALTPVLLTGALIAGTGTALADTPSNPAAGKAATVAQVDPIGERRSMCMWKKDKNDCQSLIASKKMTDMVKNCLIKAGIGGAGALVVGRVNKEVAEKIATSVVAAGVTGCLTSLV
ncbi:hypothetical protein ACFXA3_10615 [Streptomyces sp. NPDC059456]|uniref:hypothetical protein n=1 Tax=Streptomyces sp. NPDC059456 TaxID=3346838 RepID=UPI0036C7B306